MSKSTDTFIDDFLSSILGCHSLHTRRLIIHQILFICKNKGELIMSLNVGIDLGTTNSVLAYPTSTGPEIIKNKNGNRKTPSVVALNNEEMIVGREAENQAPQNPENTIYDIKKHIGTKSTFKLGRESYSPEEISALILKKLVNDAEKKLERRITNAVITVPAYFGGKERKATKASGEIAGLKIDRIINEPTAACLSYGIKKTESKTVCVYDLGGGTFDVSILEVMDGFFEVVTTDGDSELGGMDWDAAIYDRLHQKTKNDTDIEIQPNTPESLRLWKASQKAKHELSSRRKTDIQIPFLIQKNNQEYNLEYTLTRNEFNEYTSHLLNETLGICQRIFDTSGLNQKEIDEVLLVGGATRMPQVRNAVKDFFDTTPSKNVNPDEVVAEGAAIQSSIISDSLPAINQDDTPKEKNDSYAKVIDDTVVMDVISRTLGVGLVDDQFKPIIPKDTSIPHVATDSLTTSEDNQTTVEIPVFEGENEDTRENDLLDAFSLTGLPPLPEGEVSIDVKFRMDEDGILDVSAEDKSSGNTASVTIETDYGLSDKEIDDLKKKLPDVR
ncbi:MAG: Hsp70 family protein [Halobacteria archaeon]